MQHFRKSIAPKRLADIVQMSQQCAIFAALLQYKSTHGTNTLEHPNVFFMGYNAVGRLYNLFVGHEPVSTQSIIKNIFQSNLPYIESSEELDTPKIEIRDSIKNTYFKSYPVERECLGKSMLIGLTFTKLRLLKTDKIQYPK